MLFRLSMRQAKGVVEDFSIAHKGTAAINRHRKPLVLIGRQRIHTLDSFVKRRDPLVQNTESSVGAIDMQPEALFSTEVRQAIQGINSSAFDCTGSCRDTEGR